MTQYETYVKWLEVEPKVDLIIPSIKEDIVAKALTEEEVNVLRSRVMFIQQHGHAKYLANDPVDVLMEILPEAREVNG